MGNTTTPANNPLVRLLTLGAGALMALALYAMVSYLGQRHYARFDWTSSDLYTLSEKSATIARGIDQEIDLILFLDPSSELWAATTELVDRYVATNPTYLEKRVIDPDRDLLRAQQLVADYGVERRDIVLLAAMNGDGTVRDRRIIEQHELAEYDYSGMQYGQEPSLEGFKGEQLITSHLLALSEARKPKVLFTSGHGEASLQPGGGRSLSVALDLLGQDNFTVEPWRSLGAGAVPTDTDLLVVAGPTSPFLPPELEALGRYLDGGGRMLMLLDPVFAPGPATDEAGDGLVDLGLDDWLADHGVELGSNIVVDPESEMALFGAQMLFTDRYGVHPIVEALEQTRTPVLFELARSVGAGEAMSGFDVRELVRTSEAGWGERGLDRLDQIERGDDDQPGPVSLAVAVAFEPTEMAEAANLAVDHGLPGGSETEDTDGDEARLVVVGDFDFATDERMGSGSNSLFLLNAFNWLVKREDLIDIEARRPEQTRLELTRAELTEVYLLVLVLMPGLAVVCGIVIYRMRRR